MLVDPNEPKNNKRPNRFHSDHASSNILAIAIPDLSINPKLIGKEKKIQKFQKITQVTNITKDHIKHVHNGVREFTYKSAAGAASLG